MKIKKALSILLVLVFMSLTAFSQDCDAGPGLPGDNPDAPPAEGNGCDVPLDTWVYVLVIVGVGYGSYQLYRKKALPI